MTEMAKIYTLLMTKMAENNVLWVRKYLYNPGTGVLPYMGYISMCGPKRCGFSAVLVRNSVSILAILVSNRVWFFHSSLELGMFPRRSYLFIIISKTINKSPL